MFEDAGKKIKKIAKGYFIALTIIGVITGIVFFVIAGDVRDEEVWIISGLVTMAVAPVIAWLSAIMLYGFGEIVDTAIINRKEQPAPAAPAKAPAPAPKPVQPAGAPAPKAEQPKPKRLEIDVSPYIGKKYCSGCGAILPPDTAACTCGSKYLGLITQTNAQSILSNLLECPDCMCGLVDKQGTLTCPCCGKTFK